MTNSNYNFPIFQCLNPKGIINAQSHDYIRFIFHPLEAREYEIEVKMGIFENFMKDVEPYPRQVPPKSTTTTTKTTPTTNNNTNTTTITSTTNYYNSNYC